MNQKNIKLRPWVQAFFFLFVFAVTISKSFSATAFSIPFLSKVSLHAICPFGGVETLYQLFTTGVFIQKIHNSSIILMLLIFVVTILFGAIFCSTICPFGTYQEWVSRMGQRLFKGKHNHFVPHQADKILRFLRYGVLALVLYVTARSGMLIFQSYDPFHALFNFFSGEVSLWAFIILGIITIMALFIERPWCKYLCPYGAILGLLGLIRVFPIKRKKESCVHCHKCSKSCPMNIEVSTKATVRDHQCISCYKCLSSDACPIKNTVEIKGIGGKKQ